MYKIIYFGFALLLIPKLCQGQSGCHALFGFQQSGTILNFADSTTSSTPITAWHWDFGDGHSSTNYNPHHTYAHAGIYEVCLTVHNNHGCSSTYCHAITVSTIQPECHALFGFQQSDTTLTVNFSDSTASSDPITSRLWDFGDGHSSTNHNPHHTYAHAGTYEVCLTVHNNHCCSSTYCHSLLVTNTNHNCNVSFTTHFDSKINKMRFINTSSNATDHTKYLWDFGDGHSSSNENPNHPYSHTGIYTVCLFISDDITGCKSHICREVEISHRWHAMVVNDDYLVTSGSQANEVIELDSDIEFGSFPNPFISNVNIPYELKRDSYINIELYDLSGRFVQQIFKGIQTNGVHTIVLSGDFLNDKMYILKMVINDKIFIKKLLVAR